MGVSKLCSDVATLDQALRQTEVDIRLDGSHALPAGFAKSYFKKQMPRAFWLLLLTKWYDFGSDKCKPLDPGETLAEGTLFRWFLNGLLDVAGRDPAVAATVSRVLFLDAPPTDLGAPSVVARSLLSSLMGAR
ncbi:hypothetical protein CBS101457_006952 [Exobasidium rhododendri]|nr:hypothetical protein CBS101457_006952 [Exobasidium rhododendri]